jgi:hypothetical protein
MSIFRKTTEKLLGKKKRVVDIRPTVPLQRYLDKAYKKAIDARKLGAQPLDDGDKTLHVPISLFAHVRSGSSHHYAGVHHDEMHFSASLLKAAAMYAAFSLRAEARELAGAGGLADENAFMNALSQGFTAADAVPAIRSAGIGLKPRYKDIIKVTGFGGGALQVEFNPSFSAPLATDHVLFDEYQTIHAEEVRLGHIKETEENPKTLTALNKVSHMYRMIVPSNNASAGECIRRLGYAYINVKLMKRGFYDPNSIPPKGIWLAADFVGGPRVEIDSVNDGKSAQATTSRQMARLFSLIQLGELPGSTEMKELLKEAHGVDDAWISRFGSRRYAFEGVKVGVANLKPNVPPLGPDVYSEGVLLKWTSDPAPLPHNLSGGIAVCWQNLRKDAFDNGVPAVADMIEEAVSNFLTQTPV